MDISIIFKIAGIGIITIVVGQILQHSGKSDIATLTNLAGLVLVLAIVLNMIGDLFDTITNMFNIY